MENEIQELKFQVGEAWKGVYSSSTAYGLANVVQDPTGLSIYRSLKSGNVGHPLSNASWWFRIIDMSSIKAESDRIKALNDAIAEAEAIRVAAEEQRQQKEQQRIAAETQRDEAEQARISAEQQRVNKESQRETAEQQRISAEQGRVSAESARVQAEQARVLAETLRANAEDQRAANEQNRIAAEQQRIERAEQDHQRAESDHATYVDSLGAFDISSYHATDGVLAKYADLTAALGTGGANIPDDLRKGGMSVKFVQSSDNKYVQYRYMSSDATTATTFTNVANWQGVDNEPTAGSENLVKSYGVYPSSQLAKELLGDVLTGTTSISNYSLIEVNIQQGEKFSINFVTTDTNRKILCYNGDVNKKLDDTNWDTDWVNSYKEYTAPENITSIGIYLIGIITPATLCVQRLKDTFIKSDKYPILEKNPFFNSANDLLDSIKEIYIKGVKKTITKIQVIIGLATWERYRNIVYFKFSDNTELQKAIYYDTQQEAIDGFYGLVDFDDIILISQEKLSSGIHELTSGFISDAFFDISNSPSINIYLNKMEEKEVNINKTFSKQKIGAMKYALPTDFDLPQLLFFGQSFAQGGSSKVVDSGVIPNCLMFGDNVKAITGNAFNPLQLRTDVPEPYEYPVVSCANALCNMYRRFGHDVNIVASTAGTSGASIHTLIQSYVVNVTNMHTNMYATAQSLNKSVGCFAIVYMQGESDYGGREDSTPDKDDYKAYLMQVKNALQQSAMNNLHQTRKPLFFIYQTSGRWARNYEGINNENLGVSMAQLEFAAENDDVILISPAYQVTTYTDDHPSTNGYRWLGEYYAKAIWQTLYRGMRYKNPRPMDYKVGANKIAIYVSDCVLPLIKNTWTVQQVSSYGFSVKADNVDVTIKSVELVNNAIILNLATDISSASSVKLSYGGVGVGRGNICDSDTWGTWWQYLSDASDDGYDGNRTIAYTPTSEGGGSLVGKDYPMNNFLCIFFKEFTQS